MRVRQLGDLEAAVMERLWSWQRPATIREVLEDLTVERKLAYTTVQTVMDNLHRKGVLSRVPHGRAHKNTPVRDRADYSAELIASVLEHSDDRTVPLLRYVEKLSVEEVERLRSALAAADRHEPSR